MQTILMRDCDNGAKRYRTTQGPPKTVELKLFADEGGPFIEMVSAGEYRLKTKYYHIFAPTSGAEYEAHPERRRRSETCQIDDFILKQGETAKMCWETSENAGEIGYIDDITILELEEVIQETRAEIVQETTAHTREKLADNEIDAILAEL